MHFSLNFSAKEIATAKTEVLTDAAKTITIKGFRQGKAPIDRVEQAMNPDTIIEKVGAKVLPKAYAAYVQENQLKPITQPKITMKKMVADGDWEFDVEIAQKPEVKLNKYQEAIKAKKATDSIWVPGKDADPKNSTNEPGKESEQINQIFDELIKTCTVEVPELLIDEEVNRSLSKLLEQIEKLGLTVEQYLDSMKKTVDQLKQEYQESALTNLKLEFILDAIAKDLNITLTPEDLDKALAGVDPKVVKQLKEDHQQLHAIEYTLIKRKTINTLLAL
jgi:FKBP-type peptidyl-prolyl cis-trans isomerase (trigger factor)